MNFKISELSAFSSAKLGVSDDAIANVSRATNEDFDINAAQVKYNYVDGKIKSLPEDSHIREHFAAVKKLMDFVQNELPTFLKGNYLFDRKEPASELNPAGYLQKIDDPRGCMTSKNVVFAHGGICYNIPMNSQKACNLSSRGAWTSRKSGKTSKGEKRHGLLATDLGLR